MSRSTINVRTHVGRDLLQSAALFKTDKLVVWEYVANGLQYVTQGINPIVQVTLDSSAHRIIVSDNGRGMDFDGLRNFFVMHGENLDRKAGRAGRGRFGTGKSAAFGIADCLRVTTRSNGKRNAVELRKSDIEKAGGNEIPVRILERDVPDSAHPGTTVEIAGVKLRSLDAQGIIRFVERHLARWPNKPIVTINLHECEYNEPPIYKTETIAAPEDVAQLIGKVVLTLTVAKAPLDPEMQGVNIFANKVWLETTLAGAEGQPMSQFIFGEIDVPALDDDASPIPAFDMSRSMQLNRSNELVAALLAFIGKEIDRVRRQLVREEQSRRAQEEAKELAREAGRIAEIINTDFSEFTSRVAKVKARGGHGRDAGPAPVNVGTAGDTLVEGGSERGEALPPSPPIPGEEGGGIEPPGPQPTPTAGTLVADEQGSAEGTPVAPQGRSRRAAGGFRVEFREMTPGEPRAFYAREERAIYINLDFPQVVAARGTGTTDDPIFRHLVYEIAFFEYAIALARELDNQGEYKDSDEPIFDIRDTMNRIARRAASIYER